MKKRLFLILVLCVVLLLSACGSSGGGSAAGKETKKEKERPDYSGMTFDEIRELDTVNTASLLSWLFKHPEVPMEQVVETDLLDEDDLCAVVEARFPEMTMDEVRALGVFSAEVLEQLALTREEAVRANGGVDPALPAADSDTGAVVGLTQGEVSRQTGYAVPSGEELKVASEGSMELDLGNDNRILLFQNSKAVLNRFGEKLAIDLTYGRMCFYFGAPEKLGGSLTVNGGIGSFDPESRAGCIIREQGAQYMQAVSYLGEMTVHLKDGSSAKTKDGVLHMVREKDGLTEKSAFDGKFFGLTRMIRNHRDTTWTYYDTGEEKTRNYVMLDGTFHNEEFDIKGNIVLMEEGKNGKVETHRETEYNKAGVRIHERTVETDYIADTTYSDRGEILRSERTDRNGNPTTIIIRTYHPNGQVATERTEDYSINRMWFENTYDENGNRLEQKSGKLN